MGPGAITMPTSCCDVLARSHAGTEGHEPYEMEMYMLRRWTLDLLCVHLMRACTCGGSPGQAYTFLHPLALLIVLDLPCAQMAVGSVQAETRALTKRNQNERTK